MCFRRTVYIVIIAICSVIGLVGNALADDRDWSDADPADHLWSTPGNWTPAGLPTLIGDNDNRTRIREGSPGPGREYPILNANIFAVDPGGAFADRVYVGHSGNNSGWPDETAMLTITGGAKLTVGNDLKIAYGRYTLGTLYVSGSDTVINVEEDLMVGRRGRGILEMTGGTINVAVDLRIPEESDDDNVEGSGWLKLHGGTIIVGEDFIMRPEKSGKVRQGNMDIAGDGKLIIAGDVTAIVNDYIDKGWISANGETDPRLIEVEVIDGRTIVSYAAVDLETAWNPYPAEGADNIVSPVLSWTAGEGADKHDVYFGTDYEDVSSANTSDMMGLYRGRVDANSYTTPDVLEWGVTYYWRIDVIETDGTLHEGSIWSFTMEPIAVEIANVTTAASSSFSEISESVKTIDGSGLNADGLHSTSDADMWLSDNEPNGAWIRYEFDKVYKLHEMRIWNYNITFESVLGYGCKDLIIEISEDGSAWTVLANVNLPQAPGSADYDGTFIDLGGAAAGYVRLTAQSNYSPVDAAQYGLSEVRFMAIPVSAREPQPASGQTEVDPRMVVLGWRAGRQAVQHDVYLGQDMNALALVATVEENYYDAIDLDLQLSETYYWRVDEVNEAELIGTWAGEVWIFSTSDVLIIDDFENYTANFEAKEAIYQTWADGFNTLDNGSTVGNGDLPETVTFHQGSQSMPLHYDNSSAAVSEVTRDFDTAQDWTRAGVQTLGLYIYGSPSNTGGQLYVKINDMEIPYVGQVDPVKTSLWTLWDIDLASSGASVHDVTTFTVGIKGTGVSGVVYIDDIGLYE